MDISKYAALFVAESREHLHACNQLLLAWERDPAARDGIDGLFRSMHTIKGMAATMGYTGLADLAHRTEDLLDALRKRSVPADAPTFELLFRAVDTLGEWVETAPVGGAEPEGVTGLGHALAGKSRSATGVEVPADQATTGTTPGRRLSDRRRMRAVRVTLRDGVAMKGARALLTLRRAERLGTVSGLRPAAAQLEGEEFDGRFTFRLHAEADDEAIAAAIRAAGEVAEIVVADDAPPEHSGAAIGNGAGRQVRVELRRLDTLMKQVGELAVARNRLLELTSRGGDAEMGALSERIGRLVSATQAELITARMAPVAEVFEPFPRLARDLAQRLGKTVRFEMQGEEIELDRSVLDGVSEPLLHLIRNAIDHGIEPPAERAALGKTPMGKIVVSAARERNTVALRVLDDGRGIDRARILAKARREGLVGPEVTTLSDDHLLRTVARAGFSTAEAVSGVSGRGVGVDVAMTRVRALGGTIELRTEEGRGSTFTLRVPLTLAIVRALLAGVGREQYAVPLAYVAETVEFDGRNAAPQGGRDAVMVRDRVVPALHLRDLVTAPPAEVPSRRPAIILEVGERRTALITDTLLGQQEIVVAPFDAPLGMPAFLGGATILADGAPALVLDAAALV